MYYQNSTNLSSFFIAGINYKKTDACIRGRFAIDREQYEEIISGASTFDIKEFFVLSTCNRTEIYGFANDPAELAALLCSQTLGNVNEFKEMAYVKSGIDAIYHLFSVAAGIDSQILGDYEIIGQIKQSAAFAKQRNCIGAYLERMINDVLKASKKIRTDTALSSGTVSVSFAAVQYIKEKIKNISGKKILLLGAGKIGSNTCKNISDYLPGAVVTLINRSAEKAGELAAKHHFLYENMNNLEDCINDADVFLVATSANEPLVHAGHFFLSGKTKLVIDLSVPCNVAENVKEHPGVELINVDELSRIKDETLAKRSGEIPKAKKIIEEHVNEFINWHEMRKHVPLLKHIKSKLLTIQADSFFDPSFAEALSCEKTGEHKIQRVINGMAVKMRCHNQPGCHYIEAINDFFSTASSQ